MDKRLVIYCDMDGVLADFDKVPNAVARYKNEENLDIKVTKCPYFAEYILLAYYEEITFRKKSKKQNKKIKKLFLSNCHLTKKPDHSVFLSTSASLRESEKK